MVALTIFKSIFSPFIETTIVSHPDTLMSALRPECQCQCHAEPSITWYHTPIDITLNLNLPPPSPLVISSALPIPQEVFTVCDGGDDSNQTRGCPVSTQSDPQFVDSCELDVIYIETPNVTHATHEDSLIKDDINGVPASLVPPLVMCETAEQEPEIAHGRLQLNIRDHDLHDMPLEEIETEQWSVEDTECDNDALRWFQQQRYNIVLDSMHPHITPHIVITPPEQLWDDYLVPWQNRINPQYFCHLYVPPIDFNTSRIATNVQLPDNHPDPSLYNELSPFNDVIDSEIMLEDSAEEHEPRVGDPEALRVFSKLEFAEFVDSTATERLILREVVTTLHRMCLKAVIYSAATVASSCPQRHDALDPPACYEKSLEWTDPAQYLLTPEVLRNTLCIFESPYPCTIPHIILTPPTPSDHPWASWENATNDPQDCGYGRYLTISARGISIIHDLAPDANLPTSCPGTPGPETPIDDFAHFNEDIGDVVEIAAYNYPSYSADLKFLPESRLLPADTEDEDLDLPPFDSWYTNILSGSIPP